MARRDAKREERIDMEIVVDCYDESERALGWYYYLENKLAFPFEAICISASPVSPLQKGERVTVVGMPPEDACRAEIFVTILWQNRRFAVPLGQLSARSAQPGTEEAINDWHYWLRQGYIF